MSGPKAGTAAVGGAGAAVVGVAAIAAVAIPVGAVALVGYGAYKAAQAASNGVKKAIAEHEKHKGNMRAEIDSQERAVSSLLTNGESRWQNEKRSLDAVRQKVGKELSQLRESTGTPQAKKEAENAFRKAEALFAEAEGLNKQFVVQNSIANDNFNGARQRCGSSQRTVRNFVSEGRTAADQAIGAINGAVESARNAKLAYEETLLAIQQKAAEERKLEILRQNARSNIDNAKSEIEQANVAVVQDWIGEEAVAMMRKNMEQAEKDFLAKKYENASKLAQEAVAMYREFYSTALRTKQKFENREIIADSIAAALQDLQYDEPDVNYEPKDGEENTMLGNITIFAKSKGDAGDMRLAIDLDGTVNLEVTDIPEGKESECHQRLTDLQSKVSDVVDFAITDWGRAKHVKPQSGGTPIKQRVQQQEKVKQRL